MPKKVPENTIESMYYRSKANNNCTRYFLRYKTTKVPRIYVTILSPMSMMMPCHFYMLIALLASGAHATAVTRN